MDEKLRAEIEAIVKQYGITLADIETDLDTRDNYPGEFYLMSLMHIASDDLRAYLKLTWIEATA